MVLPLYLSVRFALHRVLELDLGTPCQTGSQDYFQLIESVPARKRRRLMVIKHGELYLHQPVPH